MRGHRFDMDGVIRGDRGGIAVVARAIEVSRDRIVRGLQDLDAEESLEPDHLRRPGGGRKKQTEEDPH